MRRLVYAVTGTMAGAALLFVAFFLTNKFIFSFNEKAADALIARVYAGVETEKNYVAEQSREMIAEGTITGYTSRNDVLRLLSILDQERQARNLDEIIVTDGNGIVLTRAAALVRRGDYLFQTSTWGPFLEQKKTVTSIEENAVWPLILLGAEPEIKNDAVTSTITSAFIINDTYAARFKEKYLPSDTEIEFYSRDKGPVGSSFIDPNVRILTDAYFNTESDWIKNGLSDQVVNLNGQVYVIRNIALSGLKNPPGGALVLIPYNTPPVVASAAVAVLAAVIFFGGSMYFGRRKNLLWLGIGSMVILSTFLLNLHIARKNIPHIVKPNFTIYNSTLNFEPAFGVFDNSNDQLIQIRITPGGEAINAVQAVIDYDPSTMRVDDILTIDSFCNPNLFLEKSIDNKAGQVRIACGLPHPGFSGKLGIVAGLLITPLETTEINLVFGKETSVLADDGLGTNVLRNAIGGSYTVVTPEHNRLFVFSPTHPNDNRWYPKKNITFRWPKVSGYTYRYTLNTTPHAPARGGIVLDGNQIDLAVENDGVYYFHLTAYRNNTPQDTALFQVRIDTAPPLLARIRASKTEVKKGEIVRFEFQGNDDLSGLQSGFYLKIDNGVFLPVPVHLETLFSEAGTHLATLRVYDRAGNYTDGTLTTNVLDESLPGY